MRPFRFDPEKAVEVVAFIASRIDDATFHSVAKILYFADRSHLGEYGRFVCGDRYIAMKHGPVPSGVYDLLKGVRAESDEPQFAHARAAFAVRDGFHIHPARDADLEMLSRSDVEHLDKAIAEFGGMTFRRLTAVSHEGAWNRAGGDEEIPLEEIINDLPNAEVVRADLKLVNEH
jgi:uncharacterized phage-associated protein